MSAKLNIPEGDEKYGSYLFPEFSLKSRRIKASYPKAKMNNKSGSLRSLLAVLITFCICSTPIWAHGSSEAYLIVMLGLLAFIYFVHMAAGFAFAQITTRWLKFSKMEKLFIGFGWPALSMTADIPIVLYVELPEGTGLPAYLILSLVTLSLLLLGISLVRRPRE